MSSPPTFESIKDVYNGGGKPTTIMIQEYIELDPDFEQRSNGESEWHASGGMTLLHFAALNGDITTIHLLADNGANINAQDDTGQTPLHYAIDFDFVVATQDGHMPTELPTVLAVLQHAPDETVRNHEDETALDTLRDFQEIPPLYERTAELARRSWRRSRS